MKVLSSRIAVVAHAIIVVTILAVTISVYANHSPVLADEEHAQEAVEMLEFPDNLSGQGNLKCGDFEYVVEQGTFAWYGPFIEITSTPTQETHQVEVPHKGDAEFYIVETQLMACSNGERPVIRVMDHMNKNDITRSNETLYLFDPANEEFTPITEPTFEEDGAGFQLIGTSQVRSGILYGYDSRALPTENGHSSSQAIRRIVSFDGTEIEWSTPVDPEGHPMVRLSAESPTRLEVLFVYPPPRHRGHGAGSGLLLGQGSTADTSKKPVPELPEPYVIILDAETGEILEKNEVVGPDTPPEDNSWRGNPGFPPTDVHLE